jgi:hypothetical protein
MTVFSKAADPFIRLFGSLVAHEYGIASAIAVLDITPSRCDHILKMMCNVQGTLLHASQKILRIDYVDNKSHTAYAGEYEHDDVTGHATVGDGEHVLVFTEKPPEVWTIENMKSPVELTNVRAVLAPCTNGDIRIGWQVDGDADDDGYTAPTVTLSQMEAIQKRLRQMLDEQAGNTL